ncbi:hypothetical protein [Stutzerimonas azotifigens]|uniref:hypothetical protein n=1 Tax=Stutzerimonas azotifigens TaxID=291995 RepID=UPI001F3A2A60|nr:hypothetical protein [Stutzerimonas azotifigens]
MRSLALLLFGVSLMNTSAARAEIPVLSSFINPCTRSAMLLHCKDGRGGYYGVAQWGNDMFLRGHDGGSGLSWAQTNTRFGRVQFFSGVSSDGNVWVGRTRLIGWNAISRFSTSSGDQGRISCNRLKGCD